MRWTECNRYIHRIELNCNYKHLGVILQKKTQLIPHEAEVECHPFLFRETYRQNTVMVLSRNIGTLSCEMLRFFFFS